MKFATFCHPKCNESRHWGCISCCRKGEIQYFIHRLNPLVLMKRAGQHRVSWVSSAQRRSCMHGLAFGQLSQPLTFKREHAPCQWPVMKEEGMNTFARYPGVPLLLYSFYRIENLAIKSVNVFRCSRVFTESDIMKGKSTITITSNCFVHPPNLFNDL